MRSSGTSVDPGGGEGPAPATFLIWDAANSSGTYALSNEDRTATNSAAAFFAMTGKGAALGSGKYYAEMLYLGSVTPRVGVAIRGSGWEGTPPLGNTANGWGWNLSGAVYNNAETNVSTRFGYLATDTLLVAYDTATGGLWFGSLSGGWNGDPAAGTDPAMNIAPGNWVPAFTSAGSGDFIALKKPADFLYLPAGYIPFPPA